MRHTNVNVLEDHSANRANNIGPASSLSRTSDLYHTSAQSAQTHPTIVQDALLARDRDRNYARHDLANITLVWPAHGP